MSDGKVYITISDHRIGGGNGIKAKEKDEEKNLFSDYARHQLLHFVQNQSNEAVNFAIGNIGNLTGNYTAQRQVSFAMGSINSLVNIGTIALAGFKATGGNPIGALVGAGIAIAGQGISAFRTNYLGMIENAKQNYDIEQLKARSGLNSTIDGSRGTEN